LRDLKDIVLIMNLKPIFDQHIFVFGVKTKLNSPEEFIEELKAFFKEEKPIEAINGDILIDERFIRIAALNALTFTKRGWISDPSLRLLAFLACERQIKDALRKIGLKKGQYNRLTIILVSKNKEKTLKNIRTFLESKGLEPIEIDEIFKTSKEKLEKIIEIYGLTQGEITSRREKGLKKAISDALMERMSIMKLRI